MITQEHIMQAIYEMFYLEHFGAIEVREAKPNAFFSPLQNYVTKFVRPVSKRSQWRCAACGKKRGNAWFWTTMLPFRAADMSGRSFSLPFGELHEAWTPVCGDHPLKTWDQEHDAEEGNE